MATRKRMAGPVGARDPELTLSEVFRRFVTDGKYHADGSLKTEAYLRHCEQAGKHLARYFGPDYPARLLTPDKLRDYTVERREGRITGWPVRTNTIQRELGMLKAALNFACSVHDDDGRPLMTRNPMEKLKLPREKDPKRPVIDRQTAQALRDVADEVHPFLETIIVLAQTTGRRLSAILGLRWDDIDFEKNTIRWRAETDKMRKTWVIPIPKKAWKELQRFRLSQRAIGASLLFPHPRQDRHPGKPVTRHLAAYWLKRAYQLASLEQPDGSLWHVFRRVWATERKHLPPKDVAAAGGWRDIQTLMTCYQQPDEETMREVVDFEKPAKSVVTRDQESPTTLLNRSAGCR